MAGLAASRRRPFNTRGRSGGTPKRPTTAISNDGTITSEPPPKKRRYVPGGPGGGGRYIEIDGTEVPVFANREKKKERERERQRDRERTFVHSAPRPRRGERDLALGLDGSIDPGTPTLAGSRPRRESRREKASTPRPRYSSAAAATAAMVQGDGFKPREERGWEEFHQDLDIEAALPCLDSEEVDGLTKALTPSLPNSSNELGDAALMSNGDPALMVEEILLATPKKRGPGRPPRKQQIAMLKGIGSPDTPRPVPPPGPNPREKLTLPKPTFRRINPFESYEKAGGSQDYVDKQMASMGYQESEIFTQPPYFLRLAEGGIDDDIDVPDGVKLENENDKSAAATSVKRVEYDMDEQDQKFLEEYNRQRKDDDVEPIKPAIFEVIMSFIEKEWHALEKRIPKPNPKPPQTHRPRSSSAAAVNGEPQGEEQDSKCAICDDGDCENTNAIVFCDGCDLAVHQECYGVPFIPEGQWLCRKCRVIGNGVPTCIFCPNMDGAFKQTNSSKWAHLLCAIWIPEVSLGNSTFMEPVMDVEKVPKPRWKLTCVICLQKMGACIQCGNKNCFRAFHVTCARRAKWCLEMKSSHGGPASLDASVLKAFCDKHVEPEWAEENDVTTATADAVRYYRYAMKGKTWANSQQAALSIQPSMPRYDAVAAAEETLPKINLIVRDDKGKKKKTAINPPKSMWRLPSGAPVVPAVVYDSVENLLQRMTIRKRKEFASDMCRYWTLKREARRGAPLIKRLQLQMEMFSSMEITRRDFAAMGAAGGPRLQRRKSFANLLQKDTEQLKTLSDLTVQKQQGLVNNDDTLDTILDLVYFPIVPLLRPVVQKALTLNGQGVFRSSLEEVLERVEARQYISVYQFATDICAVFSTSISMPVEAPVINSAVDEFDERAWKASIVFEQKEKRKLAKRVLKAVEPLLKDAIHSEADLLKKSTDEMPELNLLEHGVPSKDPPVPTPIEAAIPIQPDGPETELVTNNAENEAPANLQDAMEVDNEPLEDEAVDTVNGDDKKQLSPPSQPTPTASATSNGPEAGAIPEAAAEEPPTPPLSHASSTVWSALGYGGTPWYMAAFSPAGTTIHDEKWSGRDVTRDMSEELSDMGDEELDGLNPDKELDTVVSTPIKATVTLEVPSEKTNASTAKKKGKPKRRRRGF